MCVCTPLVHHSAANVEYFSEAFLLKNKDMLSADLIETLKKSENSILNSVFKDVVILDPKSMKGKFIGSQFQRSIGALLDLLNSSEASFIRSVGICMYR